MHGFIYLPTPLRSKYTEYTSMPIVIRPASSQDTLFSYQSTSTQTNALVFRLGK